MKDAAKLLAYLLATLLFGALVSPALYWLAQAANARGALTFLAQFDFEKFFHRSLLAGALVFLWPLMRSLRIAGWRDLGLRRNPRASRDAGVGFAIAAVPLVCLGAVLVILGMYSLRSAVALLPIVERTLAAVVVPFLEEPLFRGLVLGILLRAGSPLLATFTTSALFSILHFLKAPEQTTTNVTWASGFNSIANAFSQFNEPVLVVGGFATLFLLGWILADARIRTASLWLPIGLHAGWIFSSAVFNKLAHREYEALPWIGRSLLIGIAPLCVALVSWAILRGWLKHVEREQA